MYPEALVTPMKAELTEVGFEDLRTPDSVESALKNEGTVLVVVKGIEVEYEVTLEGIHAYEIT